MCIVQTLVCVLEEAGLREAFVCDYY